MMENAIASLAPLSSQGAAAGSVISQAVSSAVMCWVRASLRSTRGTRSSPSSVVTITATTPCMKPIMIDGRLVRPKITISSG